MAGHSKWAQIKHKKAITDSKKAKIFSKLARVISIAAKEKGPDPTANSSLRTAIEKARAMNMPADNIERAIKKSTEEKNLEEVILEAYGPAGCALLIQCITDNKNRTNQEMRKILADHNGKLANEGSVRWLFDFVGHIELTTKDNQEQIELIAIENNALDIESLENGKIIITTSPDKLHQTKIELEKNGIMINEAFLDFVAKNPIKLENVSDEEQLEKLYDALDENDDVQEIYSNIE